MSDDTSSDEEYDVSDVPSLADRILQASRESHFEDTPKLFLPEGCLKDLVTQDTVCREIPKLLEAGNQPLLEFILLKAPKVFAIAVFCRIYKNDLYKVMKRNKRHNFCDASLPLDEARQAQKSTFKAFHYPFWDSSRMHDFYTKQWMFLSPVFKGGEFVYDVPPSCILPFVWKGTIAKDGYSSQVLEVEIHRSHQEEPKYTVDDKPAHFAIKEIMPTGKQTLADVEKIWEAEANSLKDLSGLNHPHITPIVAAIKKGEKRYFLFPWADGGSLADYWQQKPRPDLNSELIRDVVQQLKGLAEALNALHHYNGTENYRHGDLKPENILRFRNRVDKKHLGILQIADLGLAKRHHNSTELRNVPTDTLYGTARYEPPEVVTVLNEARSRLYDIWSMGCIILEFIVWMLYGYDQVRNLQQTIDDDFTPRKGTYFKVYTREEKPRIHRTIVSWMSHMATNDPECSQPSAIQDLLTLVKTKLLVVPLPKKRKSFTNSTTVSGSDDEEGPVRANTTILLASLNEILENIEMNTTYAFTGKIRDHMHGPGQHVSLNTQNGLLTPPAGNRMRPGPSLRAPQQVQKAGLPIEQVDDLNEIWNFSVDNDFASRTFPQRGRGSACLPSPRPAKLCSRCTDLNFFTPLFDIDGLVSSFREKSGHCELCHILWQSCDRTGLGDSENVRFSRNESTIRLNKFNNGNIPVLSILRSPELKTSTQIQIGLPGLPDPRDECHFGTIREWLKECDANHPNCRPRQQEFLPTRLLDVGEPDNPYLRLHEPPPAEAYKYIALSHPWGDPNTHPHFCTYESNIAAYKEEIEFNELPRTFKDAVMTTRALGFRYLWIDSLCIIQGKIEDWNVESKRMEDVFSSAYCVLAASRATHQADGFLKARTRRQFVTFQRGGKKPFYVCESIEDFNQDVLEGSMCKRAWVLQERALAHRTVYFTERQTYWECGEGVRCETGLKMRNGLAAFLGDPNFPEVAVQSSKGGKIRLYQNLYMQYSRLDFTKIEDRPIAIAGLEKRLLKNFKTATNAVITVPVYFKDSQLQPNKYANIRIIDEPGGFGVFDIDDANDDGTSRGWLCRSLLWRRGSKEPTMDRIVFPVDRYMCVPTWSWMAYRGGIDYLDPPFRKVDWEPDGISSPWSSGRDSAGRTREYNDEISLIVTARDFDITKSKGDSELIFDIPGKTDGQRFKCTIIGRAIGDAPLGERRHYVLVISPKISGRPGELKTYVRVGVGYMLGSSILHDPADERVRVI